MNRAAVLLAPPVASHTCAAGIDGAGNPYPHFLGQKMDMIDHVYRNFIVAAMLLYLWCACIVT